MRDTVIKEGFAIGLIRGVDSCMFDAFLMICVGL